MRKMMLNAPLARSTVIAGLGGLLFGFDTAVISGTTAVLSQFHNSSSQPVRMLCICSPSGQEEFFMEVGIPVATRTTPPPKLDEPGQVEFRAKAAALAPKYRTELLQHA